VARRTSALWYVGLIKSLPRRCGCSGGSPSRWVGAGALFEGEGRFEELGGWGTIFLATGPGQDGR